MATTLNNLSKPYTTPSWMPLLELGNYTDDINLYRVTAHDSIDWNPIRQGRLNFLKNYYTQLLNQNI